MNKWACAPMCRQRAERGFTLLELLVATAIGSVVIFALYLSFSSLLSGRSAIDETSERSREASRFIDSFSREIQSAYLSGSSKAAFFKGGLSQGSPPSALIEFTSISYPVGEGSSGDLVAIRYSAGQDNNGRASLVKEVWNPYGIGKEHVRVEVIEGIKGFDLSFYNGKSWAGAWDAELEKGLPFAVRASVKIMDKGAEKEVRALARTMVR